MVYHAMNRAVWGAELFADPADYEAFARVLAEGRARVGVRVCACVLMPNHFHLVLWPRGDGDLSWNFEMKPYVGLWDALFGKKVTIEMSTPTGGVKKVRVTEKWLERMQGAGQMKDVTSEMVKVNVLEPMRALTAADPTERPDPHHVEYWRIGDRVTQEQYDTFLDHETGELYAFTTYENGRSRTFVVQRSLWEDTRKKMLNV